MSVDTKHSIAAIRDLISLVNPAEDFEAIYNIGAHLDNTQSNREQELESISEKLRVLTRTLESAKISSSRPPTVPSAQEHVKLINDLDNTKLSLAKAINSAESGLASKESELAKLKEEFKELEHRDVAKQAANELDGSTLRLAMWQAMGFEPVLDDKGNPRKMLIRSQSGDVHCVTLDGSRSDYDCAQELWHLASK